MPTGILVLCGLLLSGGKQIADRYYVSIEDAEAAAQQQQVIDDKQNKALAEHTHPVMAAEFAYVAEAVKELSEDMKKLIDVVTRVDERQRAADRRARERDTR